MYKQGDVITIGPGAPLQEYAGTILEVLEDFNGHGDECGGKVRALKSEAPGNREGEEGCWWFGPAWQNCIKVIGKRGIYVGSKVKISRDSKFYGRGRGNPAEIDGVVTGYRGQFLLWEMPFIVSWSNGKINTYCRDDLELVGVVVEPKVKKARKPSITSKILQAVSLLNEDERYETAKYVQLFPGREPKTNSNTACHAGLNRGEVGCEAVVSCIKRGVGNYPWFYKWLIDESPWSSAFIRRYAWSRKNKCVVVRTDISSTFMFGALFATRIWESHVNKDFMVKFRKHFPLELLYPLSAQVYHNRGVWTFQVIGGGHFPFNYCPTKGVLSSFIKGIVRKTSPSYVEIGIRGGSVSNVFETGEVSENASLWMFNKWKDFPGVVRREGLGTSSYEGGSDVVKDFLNSIYEEVK